MTLFPVNGGYVVELTELSNMDLGHYSVATCFLGHICVLFRSSLSLGVLIIKFGLRLKNCLLKLHT